MSLMSRLLPSRLHRPFRAFMVVAAVTGIGVSAACTPPKPAPVRAELWGDSIAAQASSYIGFYLGLGGKVTPRLHTYPGSALCDWFPDMRKELSANPTAFHPQAVLIQFSGDAFTPCMHNSKGVAYSGQALVNKYASDAAYVIRLFTSRHIPVYFISTPISRGQAAQGDVGNTPMGVMFSKLPARYPKNHLVRFINAAAAVEWHGHYTNTLPCLPWEKCTGRWPDGTRTVVVRQADGAHFCPVKEVPIPGGGGLLRCPVYMGGAARYAMAIAGPVLKDFHLN